MALRNHSPARRAQEGFTLLEVVIAISILALLTVVISVSWRIAAAAQGRVDEAILARRGRQAALDLMERQFASAVVLPNPVAENTRTAFFQGSADGVRFVSRYSVEARSRAGLVLVDYRVRRGGAGDRIVSRELPVRALSDLAGTAQHLESAAARELPLGDEEQSYSFTYLLTAAGQRAKAPAAEWGGQDGAIPAGVVLRAAQRGGAGQAVEWTFPLHARDLERGAPPRPFFPFR